MKICEISLNDDTLGQLIALSGAWEAENNCHGYRQNTADDLMGRLVFAALEGDTIIGYLFGKPEKAAETSSVMAAGTPYFEVEELYVQPEYRSRGLGRKLFGLAEDAARRMGCPFLMLGTATKNHRAILHFYIDEVGMEFWSARLFKKL